MGWSNHRYAFVYEYEPQLTAQPDLNQTGVKWIPLNELSHVVLYPKIVPQILAYVQNRQQRENYIEEMMIQSVK